MPNALVQDLDILVANSNVIPDDRRYWLLRTQGGEYYEAFRENGFVAIGYNQIKHSDIDFARRSSKDEIETIQRMKDLVRKNIKGEERPGFIANQLHKFVYQMKKGDVVVIPSFNSHFVTFGYVTKTQLLDPTDEDVAVSQCPYLKRKSVKWVLSDSRFSLDPYLYMVLQAHQAINEISNYAENTRKLLCQRRCWKFNTECSK